MQAEKNRLAVKSADLNFSLKQLGEQKQAAQSHQKQLWEAASEMFPEDILEIIRGKFDRVKNLTDSELMMDSNTSDHQLNLMLMMHDESVIGGLNMGMGGYGGNVRDSS